MWFGVGDGSAHATTTRAVEMQKTNKSVAAQLSVLATRQHFPSRIEVAFQRSDPPGEILNQEPEQEGGTRCLSTR